MISQHYCLISDLGKADAAGLAIKTRFLGDIPSETIHLADQSAVPFIEIPHEIPFIDLTMPLIKAILGEHNRNLEFSESYGNSFVILSADDFNVIFGLIKNLYNISVTIGISDSRESYVDLPISLNHLGKTSELLRFLEAEYSAEVICCGPVFEYSLNMDGGYDMGSLHVKESSGDYELSLWNEYMTLEKTARIGTFPDLLVTLNASTALAVSSAEIGDDMSVDFKNSSVSANSRCRHASKATI